MIAFGKPFIEILTESNLTLEQYFVLYCHVYEKEELISDYHIHFNLDQVGIYHKLISLGYLDNFKGK